MPKILLFLLFFVFVIQLHAQIIDTVYVDDAPFIINKKVFVEIKEKRKFSLHSYYVSFGVGIGTFYDDHKKDSINIKIAINRNINIHLGKKLYKNWSISTGVEHKQVFAKFTHNQEFSKETTKIIESYTYNGSYTEIIDGVEVERLFIDTTKIPIKDTIKYDSLLSRKEKMSFYTIPFQIDYSFTQNKFFAKALLGLNLNISNKAVIFEDLKPIALPKTYWSTFFGVNLGYKLLKNISVEVGVLVDMQLNKKEYYICQNQFLERVQLKYVF